MATTLRATKGRLIRCLSRIDAKPSGDLAKAFQEYQCKWAETFPPLICTVVQKSAPAIDHLAQLFLRAECFGCVLISIAGSANRPVSLPRLLPEAAARAMKLIITENAVKIGGTAAPWVYEIKNEGPHTRGPNDYWQLHMRGEKDRERNRR